MKGISIRQPWASLILGGQKTIEVRTRPILFRGDLLICAGLKPPAYPGLRVIDDPPLPLGVALCIVEVFDCRPMRDQDWDAAKVSKAGYLERVSSKATEFFGWRLRNVRPVEQFAVKGQLSLFNVPDELIHIQAAVAV